MVFYPCAPDQLTADPLTNQIIMRAISQAGANLTRDSATTPSGFALMVPNSVVDEYAHSDDPLEAAFIENEVDLKRSVDKASGGDGPWVAVESKQTQWSPGDAGSRPSFFTGNLVDQTTDMSPEHFQTPFFTDQSTSTTPPKLCDKFTSCSPTPSTTSTYPDSGVDDSKSASCQDLVAGGETASSSSREKRLSSADTLSTEEDIARDDRTVEDEEEDDFMSVNKILGASLIRPIPLYPFVQMADKATSTYESSAEVLPLQDGISESEMDRLPLTLRDQLGMMRDQTSMVAQTGSATSLEDDFHSPIDSEHKDEESRLFEARFFCRDAKTDTEDLAWMISIGMVTG